MNEDIDRFLEPHKEIGEHVSTGHFTILVQKAQEKSAKYRLGTWGVWAVKILQALVAAGARKQVMVVLGKKCIRFEFDLPRSFHPAKLREILATESLEGQEDRALEHLRVGLSGVARGELRPISVHLWVRDAPLYWDGDDFETAIPRAFRKSHSRMSITVANLSPQKDMEGSWALRKSLATDRILEASEQIRSRFLVAPFSLKLDGWRRDYETHLLQHCRGELVVHLRLSPNCRRMDVNSVLTTFPSSPISLQGAAPTEISGDLILAFALSFDKARILESLEPLQESDFLPRPSVCYWLKDGALVGEDTLLSGLTSLKLTVFANADDLPTDASTLSLQLCEARTERLKLVEAAIKREIKESCEKAELKLRKPENSGTAVGATGGILMGFVVATVALVANPSLLPVSSKLMAALTTPLGGTGAAIGTVLERRKPERLPVALLNEEWKSFLACWANPEPPQN